MKDEVKWIWICVNIGGGGSRSQSADIDLGHGGIRLLIRTDHRRGWMHLLLLFTDGGVV